MLARPPVRSSARFCQCQLCRMPSSIHHARAAAVVAPPVNLRLFWFLGSLNLWQNSLIWNEMQAVAPTSATRQHTTQRNRMPVVPNNMPSLPLHFLAKSLTFPPQLSHVLIFSLPFLPSPLPPAPPYSRFFVARRVIISEAVAAEETAFAPIPRLLDHANRKRSSKQQHRYPHCL